jgi:NAD(P)-dependent dehydrogenase (short-subunit alcohol dehydrogenase family)
MAILFLTGSSGALAAAMRSLYLERGWQVAGFDRKNDGFQHERFRFFETDSMNEAAVTASITTAAQQLGSPRALIATVGGVRPWKPIAETSPEDYRFLIDLNLSSAFYVIRATIPFMQHAGSGSIITIGAAPAFTHDANKSGYVAAKAGLIALTQVVANEGKEYGVNANSIVPTVIHTKANEEWGTSEEIPKWTPPESIAETCFHLTSDAGQAINGAVITMPNKL